MQKKDKVRTHKLSREQQLKQKKDLELPINKFLNAKDEQGNIKYPVAEKLRKYFINNPDPVENDQRMSNALLSEIRWNKRQAAKYLFSFESKTPVEMFDKQGRVMEKDDCYSAYVSCQQNVYLVLSKLRAHLSNRFLAKCDGNFFTFDQYDEFVGKTEKKLAELGLELFPDEVKLIEPL